MAASRQDISEWFDRGVAEGATHMLVVCDTYDWEDYPVYVRKEENAREKGKLYSVDMQSVMECYNLSLPKQEQMAQHRCFNWD